MYLAAVIETITEARPVTILTYRLGISTTSPTKGRAERVVLARSSPGSWPTPEALSSMRRPSNRGDFNVNLFVFDRAPEIGGRYGRPWDELAGNPCQLEPQREV